MIRRLIALLVSLYLGYILYSFVYVHFPFGERPLRGVAAHYVENGIKEEGATNIVTSIVTLYRGFDTLGEVTVLFLAATGLGLILAGMKREEEEKPEPTLIMETVTKYLFPLVLLFGSYIFIHGHLTPGGGFPAGVVIATGYFMMFIAQRSFTPSEYLLSATESFAGTLYVIVGLLGLALAFSFLDNVMPLGIPNRVFSAGIIPVIYIIIGFKVGSEMTGILLHLKEA